MLNQIKKAVINLSLIAVFFLLAALIVRPLLAELRFSAGEEMSKHYKWVQAEAEFRAAIRLDPFNAKYYAGLGDLMLRESRYSGNQSILLERAAVLYSHANGLDPHNSDYLLSLGRIEMQKKTPGTSNLAAGRAFKYFNEAAIYDPNGFNALFSIGLYGIDVLDTLSDARKKYVFNSLKRAIHINPWRSRDVYSYVWQKTKSYEILKKITPQDLVSHRSLYDFLIMENLWQYHREQQLTVRLLRLKEERQAVASEERDDLERLRRIKKIFLKDEELARPTKEISMEGWRHINRNGDIEPFRGPMYGNDTLYAMIDTEPGELKISIQMMKLLVIEVADKRDHKYSPYVMIRLDDTLIGETFIDNDEWKEYEFSVKSEGGIKILSVSFVNDIYFPEKKEDRNIVIGNALITHR